ncbi:MAG TPA: DnaJ domain-containing protein [Labilithrix sp.]
MAAPTASGSFSSTPFAHVLVYARNKRLTGRLALEAPDGRGGTIDLWRGRITGVKTTPPTAYLGAVLYELGWIDAQTLDATLLVVAKEKRLHGEILVERGAITAAQRDDALVEQVCRKAHHFFSFPEATKFEFFDARAGVNEPAVLVDPLAPAWRGIRDFPPEPSMRDVLAKYATFALRVVNEAPLLRVGWGAEEKALVDELLARPLTIAQLRALGKAPPLRVDLVAYLLLVGKCVEPISPSQAAMVAVKPPPPATSAPLRGGSPSGSFRAVPTPGFPSSGEVRTRPPSFRVPSTPKIPAAPTSSPRIGVSAATTPISPADLGPTGIAARAAKIATESHFEMLGLDEGASVEAVRAAYYRLAKVWHPDRLPADLAPLRSEVETIFAKMGEAQRVLTDPDARRAATSSPGGAAPKRPRAELLRDIDVALGKRDVVMARAGAEQLVAGDKDDAEAAAILAWLDADQGEGKKETLESAVARLDKAVNTDRYCDRAHYYRGVLHKRLGMTAAAVRDFARAAQINPKNVDAEREVRLAEMRARKGSGEHALGLLGKTKK